MSQNTSIKSLRQDLAEYLLSLEIQDSGSSSKKNPDDDTDAQERSLGSFPDLGSLCAFSMLQTMVIGGAVDFRRDMVRWNSNLEVPGGWVMRFRLQVFTQDPKVRNLDTIRIFVGEARGSFAHRINVSLNQKHISTNGWKPVLSFFAFDTPPLAWRDRFLMISVGEATEPCERCKFELGRHIGAGVEDSGWVEKFVFWLPFWCFST